ncbi:carbohydrate ABC transporter permease [Nocardioides xinjiangensis]|uniref:carbohydrate ABC transporter permease n=1 Tax=Nocardioides xinjiangensis TaxID=2817376 RepID=UPI001B3151CE|nr:MULTISPECIES: carbohydrate ABC transporter permease [unclassified Nocardioides]
MSRWTRFVVVAGVCAIMLFPLYCMLVVAFTPRDALFDAGAQLWPDAFTTDNFTSLFARFPVGTWFVNSVMVAAVTTAISVTVNLLAGYALAKLRFLGRDAVFVLIISTMMIPAQAIMFPQFRTVIDLGLFGTFWAVILPSAATAFGIFLARQFLLAIPDELLEAATIDGAGQLRIFLRIVLPLCKPLIAVLVLLAFMAQWNDFLWPLIALKDPALYTLPVSLRFLQGQYDADYGGLMAAALLTCLPLVVLFLFLQRYFVQGMARTGIK